MPHLRDRGKEKCWNDHPLLTPKDLHSINCLLVHPLGRVRANAHPSEIAKELQNHVNPKFFSPRCVYNGTVILYSLCKLPNWWGYGKYPGCLLYLNYLLICGEHLV